MRYRFSIRQLALCVTSVALAAALSLEPAFAQGTGGGGFGGGSSSGGFGSSSGGSMSGGSSSSRPTTGGSTSGGSSQSGGSSNNFTSQPGNTQAGQIGRSADRQFSDIGGPAGSGSGSRGSSSSRGMNSFGGFGGRMGGFGGFGGMSPFGNLFGGNSGSQAKPPIRARLRGSVDVPAEMVRAGEIRTRQNIQSTPAQRVVNGYSASVEDGVARISGSASSDKQRRMAELLLRLEPGVRRVENNITVSK
jgi:hypothetical protein